MKNPTPSRYLVLCLALSLAPALGCARRPGAVPDAGRPAADLSADFRAHWGSVETRPEMKPDQVVTLKATLHNDGGEPIGNAALAISYHWRDAADPKRVAQWDGVRTVVKTAIPPGGDYNADVTVKAPASEGRYLLEIDVVREGVAWGSQKSVPAAPQTVLVKN